MENGTQAFTSETLMGELSSWNRQENKFRELFSDEALKDRDFMKMKIAEYDRLWLKYNGRVQTTDEKALLVMLRYQRRKLERTLYPGLLARIVRRSVMAVKVFIQKRRDNNLKKNEPLAYDYKSIPVPRPGDNPGQQNEMGKRQARRYGQDLGKRLPHKNGQGKSL
jgi:hypothetical protein